MSAGDAIDRAREMGLHVERDPNDLERYPENREARARLFRIVLVEETDTPDRVYIDAWVTPVFARYYLYGVFENMRETSEERTVRGWLTRYGVNR